MAENLCFDEFYGLLGAEHQLQVNTSVDVPTQHTSPLNCKSSAKRRRLAERIAENDELVRQLKQQQDNEKQLKDLQRTAGEVSKLYQAEKELRIEHERRLKEESDRCAELEKQLDVQQLNCEQLQEQLNTKALPVDAKDMVTIFMQLSQRVDEDSHASDLLKRVQKLRRKLKDYCKLANISMPTLRSPSKRTKSATTSTQVTQTTQTNPLKELQTPKMCSIAVQSENLVSTRNQGTQHKNTTTTRGTTTASFIKKHDVGTCFPEPKPALSVQQILDKMLSWDKSIITPLSPINDLQPEPDIVQTASISTCTDLCNVQREIDYLPELPPELKRSNSRPPSRASVKDELSMPGGGAASLGGYGQHMAKELLHLLPQSQNILTNLPPHIFEEIWQVMGQMMLVVLQRRSSNSSLVTPKPTTHSNIINQADFGSWFDALNESYLYQSQTSSKDDAEFEATSEEQVTTDVGTDPMPVEPPPEIRLELTPIRLLAKPKLRALPKLKSKRLKKPKTKKRRVIRNIKSLAKRETITADIDVPAETAVQFLSNLHTFKNPNCDIMDIELDEEERQLLAQTSASEKIEQKSAAASVGQKSPATDQMQLLFGNDGGSDVEQTTLSESEDLSPTCSSQHDQTSPLYSNDEDSDDEHAKNEAVTLEIPPTHFYHQEVKGELNNKQSPIDTKDALLKPISSSRKDHLPSMPENYDPRPLLEDKENPIPLPVEVNEDHGNDENHASLEFEEDSPQSSCTSEYGDQSKLFVDIDLGEKQPGLPQYVPQIFTEGNASDVDSIDSNTLIIDDCYLQDGIKDDNQAIKVTEAVSEPIVNSPAVKRKRKSSSCSISEYQPVEKRLTRSQAKQLQLEVKINTETEYLESSKVAEKQQASCTTSYSPMSPIALETSDESDREPIVIPLEQPGQQHSSSEPKALLSYVVNEVKANAKHGGQRKTLTNKSQMEQLKLKLVNYLKDSEPLDPMCIQLIIGGETAALEVIIATFGELQQDGAMERLLTMIRQMEFQNISLIARLMNALEQRLFCIKERLPGPLAQKYLRLYLQLCILQASLAVPGQSYVNPARLLLAKILYHYNMDISLLVLEVLCHFPTVLPHREERDYDHADPLITVIKHLLMNHKYDMHDAQGADRALLSKLRFEYHFQPFEPTKQQVIENLVEKLKAGRLNQLSFAFALFCRRSVVQLVTKNVLELQLMPLANSYCDLCIEDESYDARVECLLQCISMIVKQLPLDNTTDISGCMAIFKRLLVALPRPGVQQAVVQAILRTQRFGYGFALEALHGYRPNYPLNSMTRAMMRSFAERRRHYQAAHDQKIVQKKQSVS